MHELARKCLATKHLVRDGTSAWVEYDLIELDDMMVRTVLSGKEPKFGIELKGGPLIARMPKAAPPLRRTVRRELKRLLA